MLRDIKITSVLNGWIVKVGCQTVVFTDRSVMLAAIAKYLTDPDTEEREWLENSVNAGKLGGDDVAVDEEPQSFPGLSQFLG